ncbi:hypothetical protein MGN70_004691 [Eutypa lata]|nr:hypothetical protein MGN70_004691 [Eutypa lata]
MKYIAVALATLVANVTFAAAWEGRCKPNFRCGGEDEGGWDVKCYTGTECPDPGNIKCSWTDTWDEAAGAQCHNHGEDGCAAK